ncbi:MAG: hypothetical protein HKUEN07_25600 [Rhodocyclaceae bacterium]|jgi:uncharacterized protein with HEPN domain|uniref:DUF86 domain-containing protein n=1 Tax=Candidatus Desulfobacillus denitrificans TaxID=2608985 RepID=A0A809R1X0_9PROT|nr:conserved hypothetical protein [Candidatus Desulfobacillus denitrificans]GJQ55991.1 MAG: hypothetical protein HKUEN07_25600 [Rhodocyclaceae bacterium]
MSKDGLRIPDYLDHILNAISRIGKYTEGLTEVAFSSDEKTQDAVVRNFEIIGEASKNIRDDLPGLERRIRAVRSHF